jgi:hypothetical protein
VIVSDQAGRRWFGGIVGYVDRNSESKDRRASVRVQGWAALLDTALANAVFNSQTDVAIIRSLLATYRPEITTAAMPAGTTIDHVAFPYRSVSNITQRYAMCTLSSIALVVAGASATRSALAQTAQSPGPLPSCNGCWAMCSGYAVKAPWCRQATKISLY